MTDEVVQQEPLTKDTQVEATVTATLSSVPKKIQLVPNWRKVLVTYSFWTNVASVILTFIEQILPYFNLLEPTMSTTAYGICMFCLNVSAIVFRMIKQKKLWKADENEDKAVGDKPDV